MQFNNLKHFSDNQLEDILKRSMEIKNNQEKYAESCKNKKMYMLFEKTSTRTALAFGLGMNELGGQYFFQKYGDSNFCVGEIADEIRYVARNVDIVTARLKYYENVEKMCACSPIPVINGCCNMYHPSQALADMMTVFELSKTYNVKLCYIGIWNNVFNSLCLTLPKLGGHLYGIIPEKNKPSLDNDILKMAEESGNITILEGGSEKEIKDIVSEMDYVYTDTWVDMEFFNNPAYEAENKERMAFMQPYQLNGKLLEGTKAKVLHDMPIHPGFEITRDVVEENMEYILRQAENRRHTAKGIIHYCLAK